MTHERRVGQSELLEKISIVEEKVDKIHVAVCGDEKNVGLMEKVRINGKIIARGLWIFWFTVAGFIAMACRAVWASWGGGGNP